MTHPEAEEAEEAGGVDPHWSSRVGRNIGFDWRRVDKQLVQAKAKDEHNSADEVHIWCTKARRRRGGGRWQKAWPSRGEER